MGWWPTGRRNRQLNRWHWEKFRLNSSVSSIWTMVFCPSFLTERCMLFPKCGEHTQLCSQKFFSKATFMYPSAMEIIRWHMKLSGKSCLKSRERAWEKSFLKTVRTSARKTELRVLIPSSWQCASRFLEADW